MGNNKIQDKKSRRLTKTGIFLLGALFAGFSLRCFWALAPLDKNQPDEAGYHSLASSISENNQFCVADETGGCRLTSFYPPGWPFLLAAVYKISGPDIKTGRVFAALLGSVIILLVFLITKNIFGEKPAVFSAWISAAHPILIYWSGLIMTETPFMVFLLLGLWLETGNNTTGAKKLAAGLLFGITTLIRSTGGLIAGAVCVFRFFADLSFKNAKFAFLFILGLAVLPLSWSYRNYKIFNVFAPDFHGGYNLMLGTVFHKENMLNTDIADMALKRQEWYSAIKSASEPERDKVMIHKSLEFIKTNPKIFLTGIIPDNLLQFWRLYPRQDHQMPHNKTLLLLISLFSELPLFVLFIMGMWFNKQLWRKWFILIIPPLVLTAVHAISVSQMRYRLPVTPIMAVFAGTVMAGWVNKAQSSPG